MPFNCFFFALYVYGIDIHFHCNPISVGAIGMPNHKPKKGPYKVGPYIISIRRYHLKITYLEMVVMATSQNSRSVNNTHTW